MQKRLPEVNNQMEKHCISFRSREHFHGIHSDIEVRNIQFGNNVATAHQVIWKRIT